ncbi:MAG: alpha-amylase family glycosyl hydrolase [Ignavibacteriaceae bacterium]
MSGKINNFLQVTILIFSMVFILSNTYFKTYAQLKSEVNHPAWSYSQTIYEVNLRQYSKSGSFEDFARHLPEIKKLGAGILWFMPINPIGVENRKGKLGSYYSVQNYEAINHEFGTLKEFKSLVKEIHKMGMYVIIDWVADHTSWDNVWTKEHPDFYKKDSAGNFVPPVKDWTDVIALDYSNKKLWAAMIDAMKFWVKDYNIDGFRCDVADMVPTPFWNEARAQLEKIKPVFMLAEAEQPKLQVKAFDITYSWTLYDLMHEISIGKKNAGDVIKYFNNEKEKFPENSFRMRFTSNHDENSWNGTEFEIFGDAAKTFAAFTVVIPGMPLCYNGQEIGMHKRLKFFDKDPIDWKPSPYREFYTKLFNLRLKNKALLAGDEGGKVELVSSPEDKSVYSFVREKDGDKVFAVFNLSAKPVTRNINSKLIEGSYTNLFSGEKVSFDNKQKFELKPWEYKIYFKFPK